jgi:hypothetical protein
MNSRKNRITTGTGHLVTTIVQKLWQNPSLVPELTVLHHGSYEPVIMVDVDTRPVIDT